MDENKFLKKLGDRIRQARNELGISQEKLADLANTTQNTISQYENGKRSMRVSELPQLASALKKPVSYFIEDTFNASHKVKVDANTILNELEPEMQSYVLDIIKAYKNLQQALLESFKVSIESDSEFNDPTGFGASFKVAVSQRDVLTMLNDKDKELLGIRNATLGGEQIARFNEILGRILFRKDADYRKLILQSRRQQRKKKEK
jgi:transcriptional regulator with XRE-family HTH domain